MNRLDGRAKIGDRVVESCPRNKGKNLSVIGALSLDGLIASMTIEWSTDSAVFLTYVESVLVPNLWPGAVVLMDNLSVHKNLKFRKAIESLGDNLVFLPAYSPDLSPIELCWSKFKEFLRSSKARTQEALNIAITEAFRQIAESDVFNWFEHCGLFI